MSSFRHGKAYVNQKGPHPNGGSGERASQAFDGTPFVADHDFTLYVGDVRDVLATLPDGSVDCVVTSPPYWGLRDYGTGQWAGGDPECDHKGPPMRTNAQPYDGSATFHGGHQRADEFYRDVCGKCGASRTDQQLGLETTPDQYVTNMVAVFREVRRVLAPHGTCWVNLGDSYASNWPCNRRNIVGEGSLPNGKREARPPRMGEGLKDKDLVGIPWRVAFALQADGWYLRSDIIWSKPNPMPESVTDRPTKAHEYVFLLTKSGVPTHWVNAQRCTLSATKPPPDYWYEDPDDLSADLSETPVVGWKRVNAWRGRDYFFDQEAVREQAEYGRKGWADANGQYRRAHVAAPSSDERVGDATWNGSDPSAGRNIRSVWEIATQPYAEAHFATYPEALVGRCLKAGCPEWVCGSCGKPRERIVEATGGTIGSGGWQDATINDGYVHDKRGGHAEWNDYRRTHVGWSDCGHNKYRPGIVLDPFMGSGTTALVARRLGRHAVGIELNPEYAALCARRLQQLALPFEATL